MALMGKRVKISRFNLYFSVRVCSVELLCLSTLGLVFFLIESKDEKIYFTLENPQSLPVCT